jgi:hypothetical protein
MTFVDTPQERRTRRSDNIQTALDLQLATTAHRGRFRTIVLADDLGLKVAGVGESCAQERLAALAPRLVGRAPTFHRRVGRTKQMLTVATISTIHGPLFLAALGGRTAEIPKELFHSGLGLSRILCNSF